MELPIAVVLQEGLRLHREGALDAAAERYAEVLRRDATSADALYYLAVIRSQQGRAEDAFEGARRALAIDPRHSRSHKLTGMLLSRAGRAGEALESFDRALASDPDMADVHGARGDVLMNLGRAADAVASYGRALALTPQSINDWMSRATALMALGRYDEAIADYDRALALEPGLVDALDSRGHALGRLGRFEEAAKSYQAVNAAEPGRAETHMVLAGALEEIGRHQEAVAAARTALRLKPDFAEAHNVLGNALQSLGQYADAIGPHQAAVALRPDFAEAYCSLAAALHAMNRLDEAVRHSRRAIALKPDLADAHANLALALDALGRPDEAIACCDRAVELQPSLRAAKLNRAVMCLSSGQFRRGWELFDERFTLTPGHSRPYPQPRWDGSRVQGTLLAWGEQGLGDQIIYASMVPELIGRADELLLQVEPRMVALFRRSFPRAGIVPLDPVPTLYSGRIDAQVPFGSLGRHLRPNWASFPKRERGYLVPDPVRVAALRQRLAAGGRRVIGLSWISRNPSMASAKSAELRDFEAVLRMPQCRFIDLQYGDTSAERAVVERELGVRVERLSDIDNTNDIDGLAALMAACDAVITVSNTTAHLAGAVGTPTWVMVPLGHGRLWYWFRDDRDSPWYPRVKVRRQKPGEGWSALVPQVAQEAQDFLAGK